MKNQNRNLSVLLVVVVLAAILFSTLWGLSEGQVAKAAPPAQITTTLLSEGFEGSFPPSGWFTEAVTGTYGIWAQSTDTVHPAGGGTHSGGYLAYFNSYTAAAGDAARLYTPNLDFGTAGSYYLSFWMYHDLMYSSLGDHLQIEVDNGSGWTEVGNAIYRYDVTQGWAQHTIDLSAYAGEVISVSLKGVSTWGNDIHIDDVVIYSQISPTPAAYGYLPLVQKSFPQITPAPTVTPGFATPTPTQTTTSTASPTATPAILPPLDGFYKFSSVQGLPYINKNLSYFRVSSGSITSFWVYIDWLSGCEYIIPSPPSLSIPIIGGSFYYFDYIYGDPFVFSGSFTSSTTATGNMAIAYYLSSYGCSSYYYDYSGTWQAMWWYP